MSQNVLNFELSKSKAILKNQLVQFGLNPNEWEVSPTESNLFLISNQEDSEFQFFGTVAEECEEIKWDSIQLYKI